MIKIMKTSKLFYAAMIILLTAGMTLTSCTKDKTEDDNDTTQAADLALSEKVYDDAGDIADQANAGTLDMKSGDQGNLLSNCATVTKDTISIPHVVTIDFGSVNCLCNDGSYRRGQIIVTFTGHYADSGAYRVISFNNYYVNDNQILGTRTVVNNGHNGQGHLSYAVTVNGQIILANNAGQINWTANRTREWIEGEGTPEKYDDVFLITGDASGTRLNGATYTSLITSALRLERDCQFRHPVSGTTEVTPSNKPTRILDYGNGVCDNVGTVTINGVTYNIVLH